MQPSRSDPPGPLAEWLTDAGVDIDHRRCGVDSLPDDLVEYDGLIVLGGGMGALDDVEYPWLADVRRLLGASVTERLPCLAICLGAQLLAVALGGRVRIRPDGAEVGTSMVAKRDLAVEDPLFAELPFTPDVVQFHSDEIVALPPRSQLLASSPRCANQAFRIGSVGYGIQFHIETTPEVLRDWAADAPEVAALAPAWQFEEDHLATVHADLEQVWRPFIARFADLVAGRRVPSATGTALPLA